MERNYILKVFESIWNLASPNVICLAQINSNLKKKLYIVQHDFKFHILRKEFDNPYKSLLVSIYKGGIIEQSDDRREERWIFWSSVGGGGFFSRYCLSIHALPDSQMSKTIYEVKVSVNHIVGLITYSLRVFIWWKSPKYQISFMKWK